MKNDKKIYCDSSDNVSNSNYVSMITGESTVAGKLIIEFQNNIARAKEKLSNNEKFVSVKDKLKDALKDVELVTVIQPFFIENPDQELWEQLSKSFRHYMLQYKQNDETTKDLSEEEFVKLLNEKKIY